MTHATLTPSSLSKPVPAVNAEAAPTYDWATQRLVQDQPTAGQHTFHSIQTFDSKGLPKDSQGDNND